MRGGSKSFFAASRILPRRVRAPSIALYAFCRLADDAIDLAVQDAHVVQHGRRHPVTVTVDEERKNADTFLGMFPHSMTVALDPKGSIAEAFKVSAMPSTMIVDRAGNLRYTHKGYTDKALANFRTEVVELLAEAQ